MQILCRLVDYGRALCYTVHYEFYAARETRPGSWRAGYYLPPAGSGARIADVERQNLTMRMSIAMRPRQLIVRCYAEQKQGYWVALCLDFTLAAQGETFQAAKAGLEAQIREYVYDALVGEDRAQATYLLARRAPLRDWSKYYLARAIARVHRRVGMLRTHKFFKEVMPMVPALC